MRLSDQYASVNGGFDCRLVWQMGRSGFFSEVNMMIGAMCYALTNRLSFELDSGTFGCAGVRGWEDFWKPIVPETRSVVFRWIVGESWAKRRKRSVQRVLRRLQPRVLTKDMVWSVLLDERYNRQPIDWPQLGIKGPLINGYSFFLAVLIECLREDVLDEILKLNASLNLASTYNAAQVRRGDKVAMQDAGARFIAAREFCAGELGWNKSLPLFVVADDYSVVEELRHFSEINVVHRIAPSDVGYRHAEFLTLNAAERRRRIISLLADFLVCIEAEYFVGTYSSNFSRAVGAYRRDEYCHSLDLPWRNY